MEDLSLVRKELLKKAQVAHAKLQKQDHFLFHKMDIWLTEVVMNARPLHHFQIKITPEKDVSGLSVKEFLELPLIQPAYSFHQLFDAFCQAVEEEWLVWFHSNFKSFDICFIDEKIWFMEVERMIEEYELSPRFGSTSWGGYLNRPLKNVLEKWEQKVTIMSRERVLEQSRNLAKIEIENTIIVCLDKKLRQRKTRLGSWQAAWLGLEQEANLENVTDFMLGVFAHSNWLDVHYDPSFVIWARQRVIKPSWCGEG